MTRPMTDGEICDLMDATNAALADAQERIGKLEQLVSVYGETLDDLRNRVYALERDTPQARQLQYEADLAAAHRGGIARGAR